MTSDVAPGAPVVVGVDGSVEALRAVELAARLANERQRTLRVVHAFIWPELGVPLGPAPGAPADAGFTHDAERILATAVSRARTTAPDVRVEGEVMTGAAVPVLLAEARRAVVTVVGDRGLGGFTGLLVGSVAVALTAHSERPVVVDRGELERMSDVLVGVDGSPHSAAAVAFAFEEASMAGAGVTALLAFRFPVSGEAGDMVPLVYSAEDLADEEAVVLAESVAGCRERYPDVPLRTLVVRDRPARALVHASERARLVVVGCRGLGGFTGLLLGSVTHAVLHHASCPVAVVR